jgi:hypothetical protein
MPDQMQQPSGRFKRQRKNRFRAAAVDFGQLFRERRRFRRRNFGLPVLRKQIIESLGHKAVQCHVVLHREDFELIAHLFGKVHCDGARPSPPLLLRGAFVCSSSRLADGGFPVTSAAASFSQQIGQI